MQKWIVIAPLLAVLAAPQCAFGQVEVILMVGLCKKITDDNARLKCFDAIGASSAKTNEPATPPVKTAEWNVEEKKSPIDDSPELTAMLASDDGESGLVLRCKEHKTEVILAPKGLFASETGNVLIRLNDLPAVSATWSASNTNKALFAPNALNFVKMLPDDGSLFIRATGWNGKRAADATFKLGTVSAVRDRIGTACKWPNEANGAPATVRPSKTPAVPYLMPKSQ